MKVNQFCTFPLIFLVTLLSCQVFSQDYNFAVKGEYEMPGFGSARAYDDQGFDEIIDPFTGTLKLVVRDVHLPGNGGLDISVLRFYNSLQSTNNPQSAAYNGTQPGTALTGRSVVGLGWDMHFGRVWTHLGNAIQASNTPSACKINNVSSVWNPVLELPDGTRKLLVNYEASTTHSNYSLTSGDFWTAKCLPPSAETAAGRGGLIVTSPEGITYTFNVRGVPVGVGNGTDTKNPYLVTKIEDRNGNTLNITYKNTWPTPNSVARHVLVDKVTSSDGRTVSFTYDNETTLSATLKSISAHGQYVGYSYSTGSGDTVNSYLSSVSRPDNSTIFYEYYNTSSDSALLVGKNSLKKIRNPYGLNTEYTYKQVQFGLDSQNKSWVIATKKTTGTNIETGNWTYNYAPTSTSDKTSIASNDNCVIYEHIGNKALPTGSNLNLNLWKLGILISKEIRSSCSGTIYQREVYDWQPLWVSDHNDFRRRLSDGDAYALSTETYAPRLAKVTTTRDDASYVTEYNQPDTYGNPRQIIETHGSNLSRVTNLTYKATSSFDVWLPHVVATKNISGIAGNISYSYDDQGNLLNENNYGLVTAYTYHSRGDIETVTKAGDQVTTYSDYYRGVARREDQPEGVTYLRTVDIRGNITCENVSTYAQASSVNCETITTGVKTKYAYDEMNRLKSVITPLTTDNDVAISYSHAGGSYKSTVTRGPLTTTTQFHPYGGIRKKDITADGVTYTVNYNYDPLGQKTFESYPNSTTLGDAFEYDELGRLDRVVHKVDNSFVDYVYLDNNNLKIVDERGNATTYQYRSFGHPDNKWLIKIMAPEGQTTDIVRLNSGLIDYVTQGGYTHDYGYNSYWQLTSETRSETGTTIYGRDLAGNMTSRQVGSSPVTYFYYDKLNRLKSINYPSDTPDVSYSYDSVGNIKEINNSTGKGSWIYSYDLNGNLITETISYGYMIYTYSFKYEYNANDALAFIHYNYQNPTVKIVGYSPDGFGRPTTVGSYVNGITYHPNGQLKTFNYANGRSSTITQSPRLLPKKFTVNNSIGNNLIDIDYNYDVANNVTSIVSPNSYWNKVITYDGLNRINSENRSGLITSVTYDSLGNINNKQWGSENLIYSYDVSNRLASISGTYSYPFSYDVYGNVTANGRHAFEYDHASNMTVLKSLSGSVIRKHVYDGNNRTAISYNASNQVTKDTAFSQNGKLMYERTYGTNAKQTIYIYLGGQLIASEDTGSSSSVTYYNNDLLGSPIEASYSSGSKIWDAIYEPFGKKHSLAQNSLGFTGHVHDATSNLTYMQARYYDGLLGRFMGIDPVGFSENNPMSFNRYSYGNNNPYKYTDPDGRVIFLAPLLWTAGVVALATYSDYANTPVAAGDIHTKPAYEPIMTVAGPALKGVGALGDDAIRGAINSSFKQADNLGDYAHNYQRSVGASQRIPTVLQSGGNKLENRVADKLNEYFGENYTKRDWGRALEGLKKDFRLRNDHHGRILDNGDYVNDAGDVIGNISEYLP